MYYTLIRIFYDILSIEGGDLCLSQKNIQL